MTRCLWIRGVAFLSLCTAVGACGSGELPSRGSSGVDSAASNPASVGMDVDGDGLSDGVSEPTATPLEAAAPELVQSEPTPVAAGTTTGSTTSVGTSAPTTAIPEPLIEYSETGITDVTPVSREGGALPIVGGTLLLTADGQLAVAADPDRDVVYVVDLAEQALLQTIELQAGDEPARLIEDSAGTVHVAARGSGDLLSLDVSEGALIERRAVCAAPRGVAYDESTDELLVACRSGELVWLPTSGEAEQSARLGVDLRDVVIDGDRILVSTFRQAKVLVVDHDGSLLKTLTPNTITGDDGRGMHEPHVARRMSPLAGGGVMMQHQRSNRSSPNTSSYSGAPGCGSAMIQNTVSILAPGAITFEDAGVFTPGFMSDFAVSPDASLYASITIGKGETNLGVGELGPRLSDGCNSAEDHHSTIPGQATAVAFSAAGSVVVQTREPAALHIVGVANIELSSESRADTGQQIFHMDPGNGISCASCHPEGEDDGTTWPFIDVGLRRTQSLVGGILDTAPLHWEGDRADLGAVMLDTFVNRMRGEIPSEQQVGAMESFVQSLRATPLPASVDEAAVVRGRAVFEQAQCDGCHAGERLTDNKSYDVGTGGTFQVPSLLGVVYRAPFMHDGCARSLSERFEPICGGEQHGNVADLGEDDIADIVAYMESL